MTFLFRIEEKGEFTMWLFLIIQNLKLKDLWFYFTVKYPKGRWNIFKWLKKPVNCEACKADKICGQKVCLNENGHAKTFSNICQATSYLRNKRKLKLVSIGNDQLF